MFRFLQNIKNQKYAHWSKSNCKLLITEPKFYHWVRKYEATKCPVLVCEERPEGEYRFGSLQEQDVDVEMKGRIEDPALIIFTSGTTSNSKGVLIRNYNIQHAVSTYSRLLELNENDSTILAIPIYNITGLIGTVSLFLKVRGKIYIHKRFDARNLLEDMIKYQITFLHASPTVFTLMLNERRNFKAIPSLKKLACGSSNMPAEKILELKDWMPQMSFHTIYGLTETTSPGTVFPGDASSSKFIGSSGLPIPGLYLKIVNDQNEDVGFNKIGEICLKGTNVITEYYQIETDLVTEDKWLKTGDIGYINEAGYLYILDRKKDLINRGGEKIHSIDVENAIYQIDAINEVAVVGVEDSLYGEVPVAVISLKEGFRIDETFIRNFLKNKLASFEIPVKYYFVDELYKTENGKIDKKRIRQHLAMKEESINHES